MKQALVNGRWNLWLPDNIADHDIITGDASVPSGWEWARLDSMQRRLRYGDVVFDVGTEHGWLAAIIGREFVGAENMVLIEPGASMWVNVEKIWRYNGLRPPLATVRAYVGAEMANTEPVITPWPLALDHLADEVEGMPYGSLNHHDGVPTITVDWLSSVVGAPNALNIDVEGAELLVLHGARHCLDEAEELEHVWVSIHHDLLGEFGHCEDDVHEFMASRGWVGEHLGTDHEAHWLFERFAT